MLAHINAIADTAAIRLHYEPFRLATLSPLISATMLHGVIMAIALGDSRRDYGCRHYAAIDFRH